MLLFSHERHPVAHLVDQLMRKPADERPHDFAEVRAALRAVAEFAEVMADPTSKAVFTVRAEALASLGESATIPLAFTHRADLPVASDLVSFHDVLLPRTAPPPELIRCER